ncbi:MAG TPA: ASPIC/UnbV domain-containing protein, partial [Candidatus Kapabacteria bacterium]|nr:ASPIC/UnbV domain-containing protein [Candidatus Kapabacteria bacterium]
NLDTPNGARVLHRVVSTGGSFGGNPLRLEVGVGDASAIRSVEILWPGSNSRQTVTGLALRKSYEIREGSAATELEMTPVNIKHEPKPRMKFFEATNR